MAVKATLRQASAVTTPAAPRTIEPRNPASSYGARGQVSAPAANPVLKSAPKVIDVTPEVDDQSADALAAALENGDTTAEEIANGQAETPSQALITRPTAAVSTRRDSGISDFSGGAMSGDFDESDLKFPVLKIVNGSGPLSQKFNQGTLIYADEELFAPPDPKDPAKSPVLRFVPVHIQKQYRENISEDDSEQGVMPRIVSTVQEVYDLGGSTQWIGDQRPSWSPSARCLFLLAQPAESEHPSFSITLDDHNYAPAVYYVSGGAYNSVIKGFYNTLKTQLLVPVLDANGQQVREANGLPRKRGMLWKCAWSWQTAKVAAGKYIVFRPLIRPLFKEETGPEVRNYCETLLGSVAEQAAE